MAPNERMLTRGRRRAERALADLAGELEHARIAFGMSQDELGQRLGWAGDKVGRIERHQAASLSISDASQLAAVLGLDISIRVYPNGHKPHDAAQARRLGRLVEAVGRPLTCLTDAPLPQHGEFVELRAWDARIEGNDERTGVEVESRLSDIQAMQRRHNQKRRDDPVDHFLLVVADTVHNRRLLDEFGKLLSDLPRLRTATVLRRLRHGQHPPTGYILL